MIARRSSISAAKSLIRRESVPASCSRATFLLELAPRVDEIRHRFRLYEIELSVEKRALRELAGRRGARPRREERLEDPRHEERVPVAADLDHVLARVRFGTPHDGAHDLVDRLVPAPCRRVRDRDGGVPRRRCAEIYRSSGRPSSESRGPPNRRGAPRRYPTRRRAWRAPRSSDHVRSSCSGRPAAAKRRRPAVSRYLSVWPRSPSSRPLSA